jgi:hypothetical protein
MVMKYAFPSLSVVPIPYVTGDAKARRTSASLMARETSRGVTPGEPQAGSVALHVAKFRTDGAVRR